MNLNGLYEIVKAGCTLYASKTRCFNTGFLFVSQPKLDLTESQGGLKHPLTVQFSEYDIITFGMDLGIANILQITQRFDLIVRT